MSCSAESSSGTRIVQGVGRAAPLPPADRKVRPPADRKRERKGSGGPPPQEKRPPRPGKVDLEA
ncbi:MAG: hypothetical protein Kow00128_00410 [Deltaproteobacteria bacterium]